MFSELWFRSVRFYALPYGSAPSISRVNPIYLDCYWEKIYCLQRKGESSIKKTSQDRYIEYVYYFDLTREENGKQLCTWEVSESRALVRCCTVSSGDSAINVLFGWREQTKVTVATFWLYETEPANGLNSICTRLSLPAKPGKRKDQFSSSMHNWQCGSCQVVMAPLSPNMKAERSYAVNIKISRWHHSLWVWACLSTNELPAIPSWWLSPHWIPAKQHSSCS